MGTSVNLLQRLRQHPKRLSIFFLLTLGLSIQSNGGVWAQNADTAPEQLKNTLSQIDSAANNHQLQGVMGFYSPSFTNSDGLTRQNMEKDLTQFWQRYSQLNYSTQLQSWHMDGNAIMAETVTHITGIQQLDGRSMKLDSTLRSIQRLQGDKILGQDILAERTLLTSGAKPPSIDVNLPAQVRTGEQYNFDTIVKEPLGNNLLLGAALEEPVSPQGYVKPSSYELQPLSAGGIFKVGQTSKPGSYWLSAILIRSDGMVIVTQRIKVVNSSSPVSQVKHSGIKQKNKWSPLKTK